MLSDLVTWVGEVPVEVWHVLILWLSIGYAVGKIGEWVLPKRASDWVWFIGLLPITLVVLPFYAAYLAARKLWRWMVGRKCRVVIIDGEKCYREVTGVKYCQYLGRHVLTVDGPPKPNPAPNLPPYAESAKALGGKVPGGPVTREEFEAVIDRLATVEDDLSLAREDYERIAGIDLWRNRAALEAKPSRPNAAAGVYGGGYLQQLAAMQALRQWTSRMFMQQGAALEAKPARDVRVFLHSDGNSAYVFDGTKWSMAAHWEIAASWIPVGWRPTAEGLRSVSYTELDPDSPKYRRIVAEWREATQNL